MRFAFTDEQEELRTVLRELLAERSPSSATRTTMAEPDGVDRALWRELAEMGVAGMAVPEAHGGTGFGFLELAVALEEAGRFLLPAPLVGTAVLAVEAINAADDPDRSGELLPGIAAGTTIAAVARRRTPVHGVRTAAGWTLTGDLGRVLDGTAADLVVVCADTDDGDRLFTVETTTMGLTRTPLVTMDQTIRLAHLQAQDAAARPLGSPGRGSAVLDRVECLAAAALALLAVGGAEHCLRASVAYAGDRVQFGRPIGSFQAVQHMCADMLLEVESARSAAYYAAWCAAEAPELLPTYAAVAKSYATETYLRAAGQQIQIHGGIGFTWEHDAHLHLKRAAALESLYGSPAEHRSGLWDVIAASLARPGLELPARSR